MRALARVFLDVLSADFTWLSLDSRDWAFMFSVHLVPSPQPSAFYLNLCTIHISASPFECAPVLLAGRTLERTFMDYELAKELKDAGFPQFGDHRERKGDMLGVGSGSGACYILTLEELIEECGNLEALTCEHGVTCDEWVASTFHSPHFHALGLTPTEAVARLWLALHGNGGASA